MTNLNVVVALITSDNDYQAEQAASATEVAARLGVKIQIVYADNDAVNQTQLLVKIIQNTAQRPDAIIVEPVGTEMIQVAKAAVAAGIGWGILNREPEYLSELRRARHAPVFSVATDQVEVGRIQARQFAALAKQGNILYIEGPSGGGAAAALRTKGMLSAKPARPGIENPQRRLDRAQRTSCHQVLAVAEHFPEAGYSPGRVPERCHGHGRKESLRGGARRPGTRAVAEGAVHRLRRRDQDRTGVGPSGPADRDRGLATDGRPGSRSIGKAIQIRSGATPVHAQRRLVVSQD